MPLREQSRAGNGWDSLRVLLLLYEGSLSYSFAALLPQPQTYCNSLPVVLPRRPSPSWTHLPILSFTSISTPLPRQAYAYSSPTLVDLNGDGKLEIVVGTSMGFLYVLDAR